MMQTPSTYTASRWFVLAVAACAGGAVLVWGAVALTTAAPPARIPVFALLAGVAVGASALAFGALYRKIAVVDRRVEESDRQLAALTNVRPLLGPIPTKIGGWAIDALFAESLVATIFRTRPGLVVECGSGSSTVLIAACLDQLGQGTITSLDHDARYARQTGAMLAARGWSSIADVIHAPLKDVTIAGEPYGWYDFDPASLPGTIDVLVVDGPPAGSHRHARYPAVPLLASHLSRRCVVLVDDGDREAEKWMVRRWAEELGAEVEYLQGGRGGWLITRPAEALTELPAGPSPGAMPVHREPRVVGAQLP